MAYWS